MKQLLLYVTIPRKLKGFLKKDFLPITDINGIRNFARNITICAWENNIKLNRHDKRLLASNFISKELANKFSSYLRYMTNYPEIVIDKNDYQKYKLRIAHKQRKSSKGIKIKSSSLCINSSIYSCSSKHMSRISIPFGGQNKKT